MSPVFHAIQDKNFNSRFAYHADAILHEDFPQAARELDGIISAVTIPIVELVRGGGGESQVTQRLRNSLHQGGWGKRIFEVEKKINKRTTFSQSHEVDHIKDFEYGTVALEVKWNNKDPFFDRDLENFNRLHADGGISIGMIITRGDSFQNGIKERILSFAKSRNIHGFVELEEFGIDPTRRQRQAVERWLNNNNCSFSEAWAACFTRDKFGSATTHWSKLKSRLDRGVGSPCPTVGIGIPLTCITDEAS